MADSIFEVLTPQYISGVISNFPRKQTLSDLIYGTKDSETLDVQWDVIDGSYPMAPVSSMNVPAPMCQPPNIYNMKATAAVIKHKIPVRADHMLLLRKPGTIDNKYANALILDYTQRVNSGVDFRVEWLKMKALTGSIAYTNTETGVIFTLDLGMKTTHKLTLTSTNKWDDTTNSDPLNDILTWKKLIGDDGGAQADLMIIGEGVQLKLLQNAKIRELFKYTLGSDASVWSRIVQYLAAFNLRVEVGYGVFTDDSGVNQTLVADGDVFLIATSGPSANINEKTAVWFDAPNEYTMNPGKYGFTYEQTDPKVSLILAGQNGLPTLQFPDRNVYAKVY
jgi:hypothetical protein